MRVSSFSNIPFIPPIAPQAVPPQAPCAPPAPAAFLPFSAQAFDQARLRDVPVLLFICDAPPSFADAALNMQIFERTVPVWLYPGMRPDVELLCQRAGALFSGEGALPLCALMLEDARVFLAAPLPPAGFALDPSRLYVWLSQADRRFAQNRDAFIRQAAQTVRSFRADPLRKPYSPGDAAHDLTRALLAVRDPINGGFGKLKQPLCPALRFLSRAAQRDRQAHAALDQTLDAMLASDLYDPLDGAFFRATLTEDWRAFVPEKPLAINALLALTLWVIARSFLKIATATGSVKKVRFEHKAVRAQSVQRALRRKELSRFAASPNYMLNCGLGIVTLPVAGIALLIKGRALAQLLDDAFGAGADIVPVLLSAALCLLASMNDMAAPSVSLEGRQLWLAQSLPVTPWQVLRAKLDMQLLLTGVPVLFCALCAVIVLPGGAAEMALAVIAALLYTLLSALAALALGLKMPNLTWTNEITPIKQGGSVMLALFANWFYAIALGGLYFLCGRYLSAAAYLAIFAAVTAVVCALLLRWLKRRGTRIFAAL